MRTSSLTCMAGKCVVRDADEVKAEEGIRRSPKGGTTEPTLFGRCAAPTNVELCGFRAHHTFVPCLNEVDSIHDWREVYRDSYQHQREIQT